MRILKQLVLVVCLSGALSACQKPAEPAVQEMAAAGSSEATPPALHSPETASLFTTAKDTDLRLTQSYGLTFKKAVQPTENEISIFVNPQIRFQTMLGFGGAITDASSEVFAKLSPAVQEEFLQAYYGADGLAYSLARTTIHSADFGSGSYTYIEEGDAELQTFSIEHDRQFRIPLIKRAIEAAGGELLMYASPWSPPAFMKDNKNMLQGGKLLPAYYQPGQTTTRGLSRPTRKRASRYGVSPFKTSPWPRNAGSLQFTPPRKSVTFLKLYLGPTMEKEGLGDKKIIVWDHNRDLIGNRANTIFGDPEASKYAWGIGYHWYEVWTGSDAKHVNLQNVYESYPDKPILFTEGTIESFDADALPVLAKR